MSGEGFETGYQTTERLAAGSPRVFDDSCTSDTAYSNLTVVLLRADSLAGSSPITSPSDVLAAGGIDGFVRHLHHRS